MSVFSSVLFAPAVLELGADATVAFRLTRDHVDRAADVVLAEQRSPRAAEHFDTLPGSAKSRFVPNACARDRRHRCRGRPPDCWSWSKLNSQTRRENAEDPVKTQPPVLAGEASGWHCVFERNQCHR